ncbi:MAG: type 1 glutamine amidotransferase [Chloroflexota bacterium]|nr:type 1 glutamine amidotransferase [Chloroflexota bacterium]
MKETRKRVAMVLARNFEDIEATSPKAALEEHDCEVVAVGIERGPVEGKKGERIEITATFDDVTPDEFDLLVIPGGGAPENLRIHANAVAFTRDFMASGKPIAAICHGPQLLISARVLTGRTLTCVNKIRDDVVNAGGVYVDEALVEDGNLITSRTPDDLPQFNDAVLRTLGAAVPSR